MKKLFTQTPVTSIAHITDHGLNVLKHKFKTKCKHNRKNAADGSNIEMLLTFDQWLSIWIESGHIHEMGVRSENYCMCRNNDYGNYQVGNVFIGRVIDNVVFSTIEETNIEKRINQLVIETGYKRRIVKSLIAAGKLSI